MLNLEGYQLVQNPVLCQINRTHTSPAQWLENNVLVPHHSAGKISCLFSQWNAGPTTTRTVRVGLELILESAVEANPRRFAFDFRRCFTHGYYLRTK